LPAHFPVDPLKYSINQFILQVRIFLSDHPCPLCGLIHPSVIHAIRIRLLLWNFGIHRIEVVRIVCRPRKKLRKRTGKKLQFTSTILPPFLIPHARVTFTGLSKAIPLHLSREDFDVVLNTLSAEDPRTFGLHFRRVSKRVPLWNLAVGHWIIDMGKTDQLRTLDETFKPKDKAIHPWERFIGLASSFCRRLESLGQVAAILEDEQLAMVHARLTFAGMGLGP